MVGSTPPHSILALSVVADCHLMRCDASIDSQARGGTRVQLAQCARAAAAAATSGTDTERSKPSATENDKRADGGHSDGGGEADGADLAGVGAAAAAVADAYHQNADPNAASTTLCLNAANANDGRAGFWPKGRPPMLVRLVLQ